MLDIVFAEAVISIGDLLMFDGVFWFYVCVELVHLFCFGGFSVYLLLEYANLEQ